MSSTSKQGLIERRGLDTNELSEIQQLAQLCNQHDGLNLKLNWNILRDRPSDQLNDFLYYADGQLVGFLSGQQNIWLEVVTENKHALSLYQSCGFKETGGYDYYRLQLKN